MIKEKTGLEVTCREDEENRFYFVINFQDEALALPEAFDGMEELLTGQKASGGELLKKFDVKIFQTKK